MALLSFLCTFSPFFCSERMCVFAINAWCLMLFAAISGEMVSHSKLSYNGRFRNQSARISAQRSTFVLFVFFFFYFSVVCMFVSPDFRVGSSNVIEATAKSMKSQIRFSLFCHLLFIAIELKGESHEGRSHMNHSQPVPSME